MCGILKTRVGEENTVTELRARSAVLRLTRRDDDLFNLAVLQTFTPAQIQQPQVGQSGRDQS